MEALEVNWNPWCGCKKCSTGCNFCWVTDEVYMNVKDFKSPIRKMKNKSMEKYELTYRIEPGTVVNVCPNSDFFIDSADYMRDDAWDIIHERPDLLFHIITKRPERVLQCLPKLWLSGWDNVMLSVSVENSYNLALRGDMLIELGYYGFNHLGLILEPMLEEMDITKYIGTGFIEQVIVGGENYYGVRGLSRPLEIGWVKKIKDQCEFFGVPFMFKSTGSRLRTSNGQIVEVKFFDQNGLADFYRLSLLTGENLIGTWKAKADEIENRILAENAHKMYERVKRVLK